MKKVLFENAIYTVDNIRITGKEGQSVGTSFDLSRSVVVGGKVFPITQLGVPMVDIENATQLMIAKDKMEFEGALFDTLNQSIKDIFNAEIKDLWAVKDTCKSYTHVMAVFGSICRHEFALQVVEEVCRDIASYKIVSTSDKSQKAIKTGFLKFDKIDVFSRSVHYQNVNELYRAILDIYKN